MRTLACLLFLATVPLFATPSPATVTIGAAAKKQPAVPFTHDKHVTRAKTCDVCHHGSKGLTAASNAAVKKCSACHLAPKAKVPDMREMSLTKNPFHKLCISCHKTQKKGPVACTGCHVKKK